MAPNDDRKQPPPPEPTELTDADLDQASGGMAAMNTQFFKANAPGIKFEPEVTDYREGAVSSIKGDLTQDFKIK